MTSSWMIVAICIERFIAVSIPFKVKIICKRKVCIIALGIVYITVAIWNLIIAIETRIVKDHICQLYLPKKPYVWYMMSSAAIHFLIPMTLLLILTSLMIYKMFKHSRAGNITQRASVRTFMLILVAINYHHHPTYKYNTIGSQGVPESSYQKLHDALFYSKRSSQNIRTYQSYHYHLLVLYLFFEVPTTSVHNYGMWL